MQTNRTDTIRLTQFSHGAGCGCKIAPKVLAEMLADQTSHQEHERLLVGNDLRDDAAVYDIGDGRALISTTDFFMPIVDDPFMFGRIAATNALSDVYAMGGMPVLAIAILGWPVDKLPAKVAGEVIAGGRAACQDAGVPLAGGHSIDSPEPIFGIAASGLVDKSMLRRNSTARAGDLLYLTKPLGIGILATAEKRGMLQPGDGERAAQTMAQLNRAGIAAARLESVHAMTDVTGFGLAGHLIEMCEGSGVAAEVNLQSLPLLADLHGYISRGCVPGGTNRNWASYGDLVAEVGETDRAIVCDPQTSGGLLIAVDPDQKEHFESAVDAEHFETGAHLIGRVVEHEAGAPRLAFR